MKVIVCDDLLPKNCVAYLFDKDDYSSVLWSVKDFLSTADYSIVNFECPIAGKGKPIVKCGPSHKCSESGIKAVKWIGFGGVTLANNHFLDYGEDGVLNTLAICYKHGIDTVGGDKNVDEASKNLYKEIMVRHLRSSIDVNTNFQ